MKASSVDHAGNTYTISVITETTIISWSSFIRNKSISKRVFNVSYNFSSVDLLHRYSKNYFEQHWLTN